MSNYYCSDEEYLYFRKDLKKSKPYCMANEFLARAFFERLKEEAPGASIHYYGIEQFICYGPSARKALLKRMRIEIEKLEELQCIVNKLIKECGDQL